MLKLSTKGQYGVRAMFEIARNFGKGTTTIREISERQEVSVSYLEQLLNKLRHAGLVDSVKGPGGGYVLTREPSKVSVGEVLRVLEGPVAITTCLDPTGDGCARVDNCVTRMLWKTLGEKIESFLDGISLQELLNEEHNIVPLDFGGNRP
ncbi:MAG: Rrf2 family transcriptional regulator [Nitrospirae bacterium]|nr:Rrf2 family transcriptional regulator [Nitrospirota bacterium]